jgi:hypothetical protein
MENSMEKGNHTKYPHIFKASDIVEKHKRERINMQNDYDSLTSKRKSFLGKSMNGFNIDSQMRNTHKMAVKAANMYNSIDVGQQPFTQYMGDRNQGGFFNNSNLSIQKHGNTKESMGRISEDEIIIPKDSANPKTHQVWDQKLPQIVNSGQGDVFSD